MDLLAAIFPCSSLNIQTGSCQYLLWVYHGKECLTRGQLGTSRTQGDLGEGTKHICILPIKPPVSSKTPPQMKVLLFLFDVDFCGLSALLCVRLLSASPSPPGPALRGRLQARDPGRTRRELQGLQNDDTFTRQLNFSLAMDHLS